MTNRFSRRTVLQTLSGLSVAGMLPSSVQAQMGYPETVMKRVIPGTSEMLPVIGFGSTAAVREILAPGGAIQMSALLATLIDHGASVIDTAPREYEVDEAFGKVLQESQFSNRLFIATKIGMRRYLEDRQVDKQGGKEQFERTSRLFGQHPADLVQVESMTDLDIHWPTLRDLKERGEIRYIGITSSATADHQRMAAFMRSDRPDFVQVNYSLLEPDAENNVLPLAHELGIAVLVNSPFNGGELFRKVRGHELPGWAGDFDCHSWAQFNLKYIIGEPAINSVLTETTKTRHLIDNLGGGMGRLPDNQTRRRMKAHFDSLS